jgi:EAL domain-containing protein (putative c-di-GMP-specific phosphodiesterase class I)
VIEASLREYVISQQPLILASAIGSPPDPDLAAIHRIVEVAHRHLAMDVAYISHVDATRQTVDDVVGDSESFGFHPGSSLPLPGSYCSEMLNGRIPNAIPDTSRIADVRDLPETVSGRLGSFVGVPLRLSDGTIYGTLCCAAHEPKADLGESDVRFLRLLADLLVGELNRNRERIGVQEMIADIIANQRLSIALQPILDVRSGKRMGLEALSRFPPGMGNPAELFRAAESVGLDVQLELLAASRALALIGWLDHDEFLSINLSPNCFLDGVSLAQNLPDASLDRLLFEMTENQAIEEYDSIRLQLEPLRQKGLRVAIDDAGAGYASLYHIVQLHPDVIKIDRKLVHNSSSDPSRRSVVKGFVALAADIGATVIAEGIENAEDLDVLRDLGVGGGQGYLLGRPTVCYEKLFPSDHLVPRQRESLHAPALHSSATSSVGLN